MKSDQVFEQIKSYIEKYADEQIEFLIRLCNQNSYTFNKTGVDRIAELTLDRLSNILPVHEIVKQEKVGDQHILRSGDEQKSIYLLSHMDTVFPEDHTFQKCSRKGDILNGPGTGDMKGGLTVFVYALKALNEIGVLESSPVSFFLNSDEEIGSKISRTVYEKERGKAKICLVSECAGLKNEIVISRNGKMGARLFSFGKGRHVSAGTHEKESAILEIAHKVIALEALNNVFPGVSLNIGRIEGGLGPATIPAKAECYIDIRWKDEAHKDSLLEKVESQLKQYSQPGCRSEFEILNERPSMPFTGNNQELIDLIQKTGGRLDQTIPTQHRRGTSDANFFGSAGIPTLDGLGPISEYDHTSDEYILISSLIERTVLMGCFLYEYGKKYGMTS